MRGNIRLPALLGVIVLLAGFAAGCGKAKEEVSIDLPSAVEAIRQAGGYTEELVPLDDDTIPASYPKLELDKVEDYSCNVSGSMATPEEISIFLAKTDADVESVREAVNRRVEDQKLNFEDYRPDEMPKIENAVIVERGRYVIYAACADHDAALKAIEQLA